MASIAPVLLLLSAGLFAVGSSSDCLSYNTSSNEFKPSITCQFNQHCCGTCDNRYCCYSESDMFSESEQSLCKEVNFAFSHTESAIASSVTAIIISVIVVGIVIFIIMLITCCCCPCCCMYNMCRKPRPVAGTHITTVVNTQSIQPQPVMQGTQYPAYQPVPAQPMQMGPYPAQPYAPGPPPSCQIVSSTSQTAYYGNQATL